MKGAFAVTATACVASNFMLDGLMEDLQTYRPEWMKCVKGLKSILSVTSLIVGGVGAAFFWDHLVSRPKISPWEALQLLIDLDLGYDVSGVEAGVLVHVPVIQDEIKRNQLNGEIRINTMLRLYQQHKKELKRR
jgi:hypothetical protein